MEAPAGVRRGGGDGLCRDNGGGHRQPAERRAAMKNTRIGTRDEEQEGESFQGKLGARQGKRYPALKKARGGKATGGI